MVNNHGFIIHKRVHKKGEDMTMIFNYKKNHPVTPKQVVNVVDLGYIGIENDFPNNYHPYPIERKEICTDYPKRKRIQSKSF